jgi:hypothetical protein
MFAALFGAQRAISGRVAAACQQQPRNEDHEYVRVYVQDGNVTRGLLLDPEAPEPLRACVAAALQKERGVPASFGAMNAFELLFPPSK